MIRFLPLLVVSLSILSISVFGRKLQHFFEQAFTPSVLSVSISLCLLFLGGITIWYIRKQPKKTLNALILLGVLVVFPLLLPNYVERLHFLLFGLLGFFSVRSFGLEGGIFYGLFFSFLDEYFQKFLPTRVGDFRDVIINSFSALMGVWVASWELKKNSRSFSF